MAGPFRSIKAEIPVRTPAKHARSAQSSPATGVSLSTWKGRTVVAVAHVGRAEVFDLESGNAIGSPATGASNIVAVCLGESEGRALLVTASWGGAVTIWEGPSMTRLASMTFDMGARGAWLAGGVLAVHTADDRFHVFDLVINT